MGGYECISPKQEPKKIEMNPKFFFETIQEKYTRLLDIFADMMKVVPDGLKEKEITIQEDYREDMTRLRVETLRLIKSSTATKTDPGRNTQSQATASVPGQAVAARLPRLELKTFKGNYVDWLPWWGAFEAAVDTNASLHVIDKFNFLRLYTEGEAASSIAGLALTAANYPVAVQTLKERFGRTEAIQSAHISGILKLPEVHKLNDVIGLRKLFDDSLIHIRSLESMGVSEATYSAFVKPVLLAKLPVELSVEWHKSDNSQTATLADLIKFVRKEIESRELSLMMRNKSDNRGNSNHQQTKQVANIHNEPAGSTRQLTTAVKPFNAKKKTRKDFKCLFCNEDHFAVQCTVPVDKKIQQVKNENRCSSCLGKNHKTSDCKSARPCKVCGEAHHTALCKKKTAKTKDESSKEAESKTSTTAACTRVKGDIFLQTATVLVEGREIQARATCLFDTAAHRCFIRSSIVEKLGLDLTGEEDLIIEAFGGEETKVLKTYQRFAVTMRGTFPEAQPVNLQAFAVRQICSADEYIKTDAAKELWMKKYRLADDRYLSGTMEETEVDILIGADYYWTVVGRDIISFSEGFIAISSKVGWLLNGPTQSRQEQQQTKVAGILLNISYAAHNTEEQRLEV